MNISRARNPIYNKNINPIYNRNINPIYNRKINPIYNRNINPIYNKNINPIYNRKINIIYNKNIDSIYNKSVNPIHNSNIEDYYDYYWFDDKNELKGYSIISDDFMLVYDTNFQLIQIGIKHLKGGYILFEENKNIGHIEDNSESGFNYFNSKNEWKGYFI